MAFVPSATSITRPSCAPARCIMHRSSFLAVSSSRRVRLSARFAPHTVRMNISSNDFRPGTTIELDGIVYRVQEFLHVKPGKGAAFVRTKLRNMKSGNVVDKTFKAGESVQSAQLEKIIMQHTYVDGEEFVFMNMESYEEERLSAKTLGENVCKYMMIGLDVEVLKHKQDILGVELPKTMSFTITQTDPGVKGNTAQGGATKPAIIETGAEVMVPLFINVGEKININTEDGKYLSRNNEK